jgi:hypothetical protein
MYVIDGCRCDGAKVVVVLECRLSKRYRSPDDVHCG